jgi:hypothetical protein
MLNKTTVLFNQVKKGVNVRRGNEMSQLGVNYRGSSIIFDDNAGDTTHKVPGYNKDSETDRASAIVDS